MHTTSESAPKNKGRKIYTPSWHWNPMLMLSTQRAERSEQTSHRVAARVTSTLPYIHLCLNIHSSSSIRVSAWRKGDRKKRKRGERFNTGNRGLNPSGRISWQGHVSLARRTPGVRCAHTRHSVKPYANAGRPAGSLAGTKQRSVTGTRRGVS